MKFFTAFNSSQSIDLTIDQHKNIVLLGSCFSENMEAHFTQSGFRCIANPMGVVYNPLSLAVLLELIAEKQELPEQSIIESNREYSSFLTHTKFRSESKKELQEKFTRKTSLLHDSPNVFIITLGTAWIYRHIESKLDVANCHKLPSQVFSKRLLDITTVMHSISTICKSVNKMDSRNKVIFTLSPVRHLKDGFIENQTSKSILHLAIQQSLKKNKTYYFPAYEIMMDELRDYRFYNADLIHPNEQAIRHIWSYFTKFFRKS